ncbi:zinc finger, CCHC-type containing protein [Tanacetum coccineum]
MTSRPRTRVSVQAPFRGVTGSVVLEVSSGKSITLFNVLYVLKLLPDDYGSVYMSSFTVIDSSLWHARLGHVHYKSMLEMSKDDLIPAIDENSEKCTTCMLTKITRQPFKSITRKSVILELIHSDLCDFHATPSLGNKKIIHETTTPYIPQQNGMAERKNIALKEMVNSMLSYSGLSEGAVVRLSDQKRKTLGEKGIDCIFVGYDEHSKAYRPNDIIPNSDESQRDDHSDDVPSETPKPRKDKRVRKAKSYGFDFQLYLVEGSRDQIGSQYSYFYSIKENPRIYNEVMQSQDAAFWKEAIDDEIGSIMENNTWVLFDLPPGCKWIFKRKMKVDGTIDKFKARLIIQGFRQKERIDYFDTYAPVACITTIRLLLALAAIHNLVIHQMDVKTTFLNGDLDEEVYMKQPEGFVMPSNEHKCVYSKFDSSGKGVIICLYVDDMLIFGTDQNQVDKTKKFLSSRFLMKDMGEADVILGIKIKRENKGIVITQSHYIEKILKKFNHEDCSPVSTPMDPVEKLKPNTGKPVDQLEYSRAIGCLMYAMTSTRPDIAYAVGRLSRFTSNPSRQHWHAITRVFKYLKGTMNYSLSYVGYPSVLEAYSDTSWINHVEDSSSTSGWVFLLGGGAISWASKKQTCITGSTMESEFVALAAAGKEAE